MNKTLALFAPDNYVPISTFRVCDDTSAYAEMEVRPDLLAFLIACDASIQVAAVTAETVHYQEVLHVDRTKGLVRIETKEAGRYTIVTEALQNTYPIVTNWNAGLNGGRGGPQAGGTDGIGELRLNEETGAPASDLSVLRDSDPASPYYYRSDAYALFAGEEEGAHYRTTAYERYIGETYSLVRVTEAVAVQLSDDTLKQTGYPVIVRSPDAAPEQLEGIPAFQLVHGCIVGQGEHRSMGSYLLPPYWSRKPKQRYPVLFSGFYDQNENVFVNVGPPLLKVLGEMLLETGNGAVGIIWNGGGSTGTRTLQESIYDNLDDLFSIAVERYGADAKAIVTVGGSRGGITSLLAAGNPNNSMYTVRYAVCYNVPFSFGAPLREMVNPTCPVYARAICEDIGFKDAWQPGWTDPEGRTAIERFESTLLGTNDTSLMARDRAPGSDRVIRTLQERGTQVWLTHGTHDAFTASWLAFEWVARARRNGVQVRHEIGYRFGHNNCTNPFDSAKQCLLSLSAGEPLRMEGTWHYRRASELPEQWELAEQFQPVQRPVFLEGPKIAVKGLPFLLNLYGEPGLLYRLTLIPSIEQAAADPIVLLQGTLESLEGYDSSFSFVKSVQIVSERYTPGLYVYDLQVSKDSGIHWEKTADYAPHPGYEGQPTLEVIAEVPNFSTEAWLERTTKYAIGWGLSEV